MRPVDNCILSTGSIHMEQSYEVKRLTSTRDKLYVPAINIYAESMSSDVRTSTNEIAVCVDGKIRSPNKYFCFALCYQRVVIGYAQAAFISKGKILFIDYFTIKDEYKKNSIFYPLFSIFLLYFSQNNIYYDYIVTEIGHQGSTKIDGDSAFLQKVLFIEDFLSIKAPYKQPELGIYKEETNIDANLYIRFSDSLSSIPKSTYLLLVNHIFYDHYLVWYQNFLKKDEADIYKKHLDQTFASIKQKLAKVNTVSLLDRVSLDCKYFSECCKASQISTAGFAPLPAKKKRLRWLSSIVVFFAVILISVLLYLLIGYLDMSNEVFSGVFTATTALALGVTTYLFDNKS